MGALGWPGLSHSMLRGPRTVGCVEVHWGQHPGQQGTGVGGEQQWGRREAKHHGKYRTSGILAAPSTSAELLRLFLTIHHRM